MPMQYGTNVDPRYEHVKRRIEERKLAQVAEEQRRDALLQEAEAARVEQTRLAIQEARGLEAQDITERGMAGAPLPGSFTGSLSVQDLTTFGGPKQETYKPQTSDYDYGAAADVMELTGYSMKDEGSGHWGSRIFAGPLEGLIVKAPGHDSYDEMVKDENKRGYEIVKFGNKEFSVKVSDEAIEPQEIDSETGSVTGLTRDEWDAPFNGGRPEDFEGAEGAKGELAKRLQRRNVPQEDRQFDPLDETKSLEDWSSDTYIPGDIVFQSRVRSFQEGKEWAEEDLKNDRGFWSSFNRGGIQTMQGLKAQFMGLDDEGSEEVLREQGLEALRDIQIAAAEQSGFVSGMMAAERPDDQTWLEKQGEMLGGSSPMIAAGAVATTIAVAAGPPGWAIAGTALGSGAVAGYFFGGSGADAEIDLIELQTNIIRQRYGDYTKFKVSDEVRDRIVMQSGAWEAGSEGLTSLLGFGIGKFIGKSFFKVGPGTTMKETVKESMRQVFRRQAIQKTAPEIARGVLKNSAKYASLIAGDLAMEGVSEVVAEYGQTTAMQELDPDREADFLGAFWSGVILGGFSGPAMMGVGVMNEKVMRDRLEARIAARDVWNSANYDPIKKLEELAPEVAERIAALPESERVEEIAKWNRQLEVEAAYAEALLVEAEKALSNGDQKGAARMAAKAAGAREKALTLSLQVALAKDLVVGTRVVEEGGLVGHTYTVDEALKNKGRKKSGGKKSTGQTKVQTTFESMGFEVVWFDKSDSQADAFYDPKTPGVIYLEDRATVTREGKGGKKTQVDMNPTYVIARGLHESLHYIQYVNPELHEELKEIVGDAGALWSAAEYAMRVEGSFNDNLVVAFAQHITDGGTVDTFTGYTDVEGNEVVATESDLAEMQAYAELEGMAVSIEKGVEAGATTNKPLRVLARLGLMGRNAKAAVRLYDTLLKTAHQTSLARAEGRTVEEGGSGTYTVRPGSASFVRELLHGESIRSVSTGKLLSALERSLGKDGATEAKEEEGTTGALEARKRDGEKDKKTSKKLPKKRGRGKKEEPKEDIKGQRDSRYGKPLTTVTLEDIQAQFTEEELMGGKELPYKPGEVAKTSAGKSYSEASREASVNIPYAKVEQSDIDTAIKNTEKAMGAARYERALGFAKVDSLSLDATFFNDSINLPSSIRFWYETFGEDFLNRFVGMSEADARQFADVVSATSPRTPVPDNIRKAVSIFLDQKLGVPSPTAVSTKEMVGVQKALTGKLAEGGRYKTGSFANTFLYAMGMVSETPLSTNDIIMGNIYGIKGENFTNPLVYEMISRLHVELATMLNGKTVDKRGLTEADADVINTPWTPWQVQAVMWSNRQDNTGTYSDELVRIFEEWQEAGIPVKEHADGTLYVNLDELTPEMGLAGLTKATVRGEPRLMPPTPLGGATEVTASLGEALASDLDETQRKHITAAYSKLRTATYDYVSAITSKTEMPTFSNELREMFGVAQVKAGTGKFVQFHYPYHKSVAMVAGKKFNATTSVADMFAGKSMGAFQYGGSAQRGDLIYGMFTSEGGVLVPTMSIYLGGVPSEKMQEVLTYSASMLGLSDAIAVEEVPAGQGEPAIGMFFPTQELEFSHISALAIAAGRYGLVLHSMPVANGTYLAIVPVEGSDINAGEESIRRELQSRGLSPLIQDTDIKIIDAKAGVSGTIEQASKDIRNKEVKNDAKKTSKWYTGLNKQDRQIVDEVAPTKREREQLLRTPRTKAGKIRRLSAPKRERLAVAIAKSQAWQLHHFAETLANTRAEQQQKLAVRTEEVLTKKKIGKQTVGKWLDAGGALESRRLTEAKFRSGYSQHIDIRSRKTGKGLELATTVMKEGWKPGIGVNVLPVSVGDKPITIPERQYMPKKGDVVYLVPNDWITGFYGPGKIKEGWKPKPFEVVVVEYDNQSMYELYTKATSGALESRKTKKEVEAIRETQLMGSVFPKIREAMQMSEQRKMTAKQLRKMLEKNGVNEQEQFWSGLEEFLETKGEESFDIDEAIEAVRPVKLSEKILTNEEARFRSGDKWQAVPDFVNELAVGHEQIIISWDRAQDELDVMSEDEWAKAVADLEPPEPGEEPGETFTDDQGRIVSFDEDTTYQEYLQKVLTGDPRVFRGGHFGAADEIMHQRLFIMPDNEADEPGKTFLYAWELQGDWARNVGRYGIGGEATVTVERVMGSVDEALRETPQTHAEQADLYLGYQQPHAQRITAGVGTEKVLSYYGPEADVHFRFTSAFSEGMPLHRSTTRRNLTPGAWGVESKISVDDGTYDTGRLELPVSALPQLPGDPNPPTPIEEDTGYMDYEQETAETIEHFYELAMNDEDVLKQLQSVGEDQFPLLFNGDWKLLREHPLWDAEEHAENYEYAPLKALAGEMYIKMRGTDEARATWMENRSDFLRNTIVEYGADTAIERTGFVTDPTVREIWEDALAESIDRYDDAEAVPPGPFVSTPRGKQSKEWVGLGVKRMLAKAVADRHTALVIPSSELVEKVEHIGEGARLYDNIYSMLLKYAKKLDPSVLVEDANGKLQLPSKGMGFEFEIKAEPVEGRIATKQEAFELALDKLFLDARGTRNFPSIDAFHVGEFSKTIVELMDMGMLFNSYSSFSVNAHQQLSQGNVQWGNESLPQYTEEQLEKAHELISFLRGVDEVTGESKTPIDPDTGEHEVWPFATLFDDAWNKLDRSTPGLAAYEQRLAREGKTLTRETAFHELDVFEDMVDTLVRRIELSSGRGAESTPIADSLKGYRSAKNFIFKPSSYLSTDFRVRNTISVGKGWDTREEAEAAPLPHTARFYNKQSGEVLSGEDLASAYDLIGLQQSLRHGTREEIQDEINKTKYVEEGRNRVDRWDRQAALPITDKIRDHVQQGLPMFNANALESRRQVGQTIDKLNQDATAIGEELKALVKSGDRNPTALPAGGAIEIITSVTRNFPMVAMLQRNSPLFVRGYWDEVVVPKLADVAMAFHNSSEIYFETEEYKERKGLENYNLLKYGMPSEPTDSSLADRWTSSLVEVLPGGDKNMTPSDSILNLSRLLYHLALEYSIGERTALSEAMDYMPDELFDEIGADLEHATNPTFLETDTGQQIIHILAAQNNLDPAIVAQDADVIELRAQLAQKVIDFAKSNRYYDELREAVGRDVYYALSDAKVHDAFTQTPDEMWQQWTQTLQFVWKLPVLETLDPKLYNNVSEKTGPVPSVMMEEESEYYDSVVTRVKGQEEKRRVLTSNFPGPLYATPSVPRVHMGDLAHGQMIDILRFGGVPVDKSGEVRPETSVMPGYEDLELQVPVVQSMSQKKYMESGVTDMQHLGISPELYNLIEETIGSKVTVTETSLEHGVAKQFKSGKSRLLSKWLMTKSPQSTRLFILSYPDPLTAMHKDEPVAFAIRKQQFAGSYEGKIFYLNPTGNKVRSVDTFRMKDEWAEGRAAGSSAVAFEQALRDKVKEEFFPITQEGAEGSTPLDVFREDTIALESRKRRDGTPRMVAISMVTQGALQMAIEGGGFPMPSIGVTAKDRITVPDNNFGEIYLVFDPNVIKQHGVFTGDAYTQRTADDLVHGEHDALLSPAENMLNAMRAEQEQAGSIRGAEFLSGGEVVFDLSHDGVNQFHISQLAALLTDEVIFTEKIRGVVEEKQRMESEEIRLRYDDDAAWMNTMLEHYLEGKDADPTADFNKAIRNHVGEYLLRHTVDWILNNTPDGINQTWSDILDDSGAMVKMVGYVDENTRDSIVGIAEPDIDATSVIDNMLPQILKSITALPQRWLESKPQDVIPFGKGGVVAALVPSNASENVVGDLEAQGVTVKVYKSAVGSERFALDQDMTERHALLDEMEDTVLFSRKKLPKTINTVVNSPIVGILGREAEERLGELIGDRPSFRRGHRAGVSAGARVQRQLSDREKKQALRDERERARIQTTMRVKAMREMLERRLERLKLGVENKDKIRETAIALVGQLPQRLRGKLAIRLARANTNRRVELLAAKVVRVSAEEEYRVATRRMKKVIKRLKKRKMGSEAREELQRLIDLLGGIAYQTGTQRMFKQGSLSVVDLISKAAEIESRLNEAIALVRQEREDWKLARGERAERLASVAAKIINSLQQKPPRPEHARGPQVDRPSKPLRFALSKNTMSIIADVMAGNREDAAVVADMLHHALTDGEAAHLSQIRGTFDVLNNLAKEAGFDNLDQLMDVAGVTQIEVETQTINATFGGQKLQLTLDQAMKLYAFDEETLDKIVDEVDADGNVVREGVGIQTHDGRTVTPIKGITRQEVSDVIDQLPAGVRGLIDRAKAHRETVLRPLAFGAFYEIHGYEPRFVPGYEPTSRERIKNNPAERLQISEMTAKFLDDAGFTKERTATSGAVILGGFVEDFMSNADAMSKLGHMAIPARDAISIINHRDVYDAINKHMGAEVRADLEARILHGAGMVERTAGTLGMIVAGNVAGAYLSLNPRTYGRIYFGGISNLSLEMSVEEILVGQASLTDLNAVLEEAHKNGYLWARANSGAMRRQLQSFEQKPTKIADKAAFFNRMRKIAKTLARASKYLAQGNWSNASRVTKEMLKLMRELPDDLHALQALDNLIVATAYVGVRSRLMRQGYSGAELIEMAGTETERVIRVTQNSSSPLDATVLDAKDAVRGSAYRMLFPFSSDPSVTGNTLYRATRHGTKRQKVRAAGGFTAMVAVSAGWTLSFEAVRRLIVSWFDDDEDEDWIEEQMKYFVNEENKQSAERRAMYQAADEIVSRFGYPGIIFSWLLSIPEGYEPGLPHLWADPIADATRSTLKIYNATQSEEEDAEEKLWEGIWDLTEPVRLMVGDPTLMPQKQVGRTQTLIDPSYEDVKKAVGRLRKKRDLTEEEDYAWEQIRKHGKER